jgi:ABC-2 type transport system permease protein
MHLIKQITMNIINSALLKFALLPSALYRKMGVNTKHLKVILNAKLIMDDRRPNTFQQIQRKKNNKPINFATLGTMLWSALMGFVFLSSFSLEKVMKQNLHFTFHFM